MTPTETIRGREWLLFPGCKPIQATALPAGLDPATAIGHGVDSDERFTPGPPPGTAASPAPAAKAAKRAKTSGPGGMFDQTKPKGGE